MKIPQQILCPIIFLISLFSILPNLNAMPIPQPGENIWHLIAATGTQVDQIATSQSNCCIGTFTALNSVENKIETLTNTVNDDFAGTFSAIAAIPTGSCDLSGTFTVLNSILNQELTIEDKIDVCCSCNQTPITLGANGTTIQNSGVYCLTDDVPLANGSNITIKANDVILDLNEHTVNGGDGIRVTSNFNRISVQNGSLTNASNGIFASNNSELFINNLMLFSCSNGLFLNNLAASSIESCSVSSSSNFAYFIQDSNNTTIKNCIANNATAVGFYIAEGHAVTVDSCFSNSCSNGFVMDGADATNSTIIKNCQALNSDFGYSIGSGASNGTYLLDSCSALVFSTQGFSINQSNGLISNCKAIAGAATSTCFSLANCTKCSLVNSAAEGGQIGFQGVAIQNCQFSNCSAYGASQNGFDLSNATNTTIQVFNCSSTSNGNNGFFGNGTNGVLFYLNTAANNATNYAGITFIGSQSAPENTFNAPIRYYGDNLKNS